LGSLSLGYAEVSIQTPIGPAEGTSCQEKFMGLVLSILAIVLAVVGVVQLLQGQIILGIVLLVVAALVGPGGYSMFRRA
jgi:hypothetical protein